MGNTMPPEATPQNGALFTVALVLLSQLPTTVTAITNPAVRAGVAAGLGVLLLLVGYFMTPAKPKQ